MKEVSTASYAADEVRGDLFVNRRFEWERFVMVPHAWIRDTRITGNPMSLLLAIRMHADGFLMTTEGLKKQLGLGKDAFVRARKVLVDAGYLRHEVRRYEGPGGGLPSRLGLRKGQVIGSRYEVMDPWAPSFASAQEIVPEPDLEDESGTAKNARSEAGGGKPEVDDSGAEDLEVGFPPLNKIKINNTRHTKKNDHHRGSHRARHGVAPQVAKPEVDLGKIKILLQAQGVAPDIHEIEMATRDVLGRARGVVNDPNAYVARAIVSDQVTWRRRSARGGALLTVCDVRGHSPVFDGVESYCGRCAADVAHAEAAEVR